MLGAIEQNIDFEKRLNKIYQTCRKVEEITAAFDELQAELDEIINERVNQTKKFLVENFDEDVISKLKISSEQGISMVDRYNRHLWNLVVSTLQSYAINIDHSNFSLTISGMNEASFPDGYYTINKNIDSARLIRLTDATGRYIINQALSKSLKEVTVTFDLSAYPRTIAILDQQRGNSGYMAAYVISSENQRDSEERMIFCTIDDSGNVLDAEFGERLMDIPAIETSGVDIAPSVKSKLSDNFAQRFDEYKHNQERSNNDYVALELDKLEAWCDERITSLENEVVALDKECKSIKKEIRQEFDARRKLELSSLLSSQEKLLRKKRTAFFEAQDENEDIKDRKREEFIAMLNNTLSHKMIFIMRWQLR